MSLAGRMDELCARYHLTHDYHLTRDDLNLDLGPPGTLLPPDRPGPLWALSDNSRRARDAGPSSASAPGLADEPVYAASMSGDSAVADLVDVLETFVERAAAPGGAGEVLVSLGVPQDAERRTVRLTAQVADRLTELVRSQLEALRAVERDDQVSEDGSPSAQSEVWLG